MDAEELRDLILAWMGASDAFARAAQLARPAHPHLDQPLHPPAMAQCVFEITDLCGVIGGFLDGRSLARFGETSRCVDTSLRQRARLWEALCFREFGITPAALRPPPSSAKGLYAQLWATRRDLFANAGARRQVETFFAGAAGLGAQPHLARAAMFGRPSQLVGPLRG